MPTAIRRQPILPPARRRRAHRPGGNVMVMNALRNAAGDSDEEVQMLNSIERWVARELKPIVREYDHADRYPSHIVEQMKELGLFGATISPDYGGLGLPASTYAKIVMSISSVWMSITGIINSHLI